MLAKSPPARDDGVGPSGAQTAQARLNCRRLRRWFRRGRPDDRQSAGRLPESFGLTDPELACAPVNKAYPGPDSTRTSAPAVLARHQCRGGQLPMPTRENAAAWYRGLVIPDRL